MRTKGPSSEKANGSESSAPENSHLLALVFVSRVRAAHSRLGSARPQTTRKQTVLYNLFEWPSRRDARLVVVGIANTIDLPERCLPRVSSRVTSRLTFGPYHKQQVRGVACGRT